MFFCNAFFLANDIVLFIQNKDHVSFHWLYLAQGPFKYYVIKEVDGWGQKMAIFDDLQYCKSSKRWVGWPKKVKNMMT